MEMRITIGGVLFLIFATGLLAQQNPPIICIMHTVWISDGATLKVHPLEPCQIAAPHTAFSFSKMDFETWDHLRERLDQIRDLQKMEVHDNPDRKTDGVWAVELVKSFREQRKLLCARHSDWWIVNLTNDAVTLETQPQPCH
jgi:hypothetical protein